MKLHKDLICEVCAACAQAERRVAPRAAVDHETAGAIATASQVILFSAAQALALRPALEQLGEVGEYRLPFENICIQFDRPIPETEFFQIEPGREHHTDPNMLSNTADLWRIADIPLPGWAPDQGDAITDLLLHQREEDGVIHCQSTAFFVTGAVSRSYWRGGGPVFYEPGIREAISDEAARNQKTLRDLAFAIATYLNAESIVLERITAPPKVNAKRKKKGKAPLEDYYVCRIRGERYGVGEGEGVGRHVGFRFDVRGHFRRLPSGRITWVRPHQRGVEYLEYHPKVYDARKEPPE